MHKCTTAYNCTAKVNFLINKKEFLKSVNDATAIIAHLHDFSVQVCNYSTDVEDNIIWIDDDLWV